MPEIRRKQGETFESLIRRFRKKIQQSGVLLQSKKIRYYQKPLKKNKARTDTLRRLQVRAKKEYLKKIGKLKDDDFRSR